MYNGNKISKDAQTHGKEGHPNYAFVSAFNGAVERVRLDVYIGVGVPDITLGEANDKYIDISGLKFYVRGATVWDGGTALGNTSVATVKLTAPLN